MREGDSAVAVKAGDLELDLTDSLIESVAGRLEHEPPAAYREFVRQYYHWVPAKDLADRRAEDLAGAIVSHWRLAHQRERGEVKVIVYNPDLAANLWESPYTVIEVVSDDMPFLVDSVTMELARQGYGIELIVHPVMRVVRDGDGMLREVLASGAAGVGWQTESVIHVEVARQAAPERLAVLHSGIEVVLEEVRAAVEDWGAMRARTIELATELRRQAPPCGSHELAETQAFLAWLANENFTFLGYREYRLGGEGDGESPGELTAVEGTGLGILRGTSPGPPEHLKERALREALSPHPLALTKANSRATVHRPAYLDYVGVKQFAPDGRVIGERRFLGLYTTDAYRASPREIPLLRDKFSYVMDKAGFPDDTHNAKGLVDILESLPRDLLMQIDADDLFEVAIGILGLGERQQVRLFVVPGRLNRFVYCTLCLPRDRFNTENRLRAGRILADAFGGDQVDWRPYLSESLIVRVDYIVHCPAGIKPGYEVAAVEARVARATRAWGDDLRAALITEHGEQRGLELYAGYATAFPPGYRADNDATTAIADIARIERLQVAAGRFGGTQIHIYRRRGDSEQTVRGKLLSITPVSLSAVVPKFEHMGATVVDERPYEISPRSGGPVWVYDFGLRCDPEDLDRAGDAFAPAFLGAWTGELEDDRLNGLVMRAGLTGREVTIVRAVLRYLRQSAIAFSDAYMIQTLLDNPEIARRAVALFAARFDPDAHDPHVAERLSGELKTAIDTVESLDADRILRSFLAVLAAMLRTNYYRLEGVGGERVAPAYLSFKLDATRLEFLPRPRPRYEIFVYSPRVEGVHLRGGSVARGGLRWSDRREDFRTEVLGLMKAQMVKNALIVPVGSKGGFVVKRPPARGAREAQMAEGIACYRIFLSGLLDLTDNYVGGEVVAPERVIRYDGDDPYLVVAADKGTAAFSDIANEVAAGYGFWLGDAFASGGSHGYDHKRMGITARGAWESVKRHFRELGTDVARQDIKVVGIGDMAGDVFGNGMLLSPHIRLVAAFNHAHVFLDPDPDSAVGFAERQRLFALPRSGWDDYDRSLISSGGGVHSRACKAIAISDEVRAALGIEAASLTPNDLISAILRAPVDLLFNGGIGTYVKAGSESHRDAGDRANDGVRVDGAQLRCRVVAEGGNLGLTQRGRIEYALEGGVDGGGGRINTDAIDNAAGVNCSDHEVNIKILLGQLTAAGEISDRERNELLRQMTDAVADEVLYASYTQTQAMSIALSQATSMVQVHARLIRHLERVALLDRDIEFLPSEEALAARRGERRGLSSPELATVMAYTKIQLYMQLLDSNLPEDPSLVADLQRYFPEPLPERYAEQMRDHRLRRELVATIVSNQLVDRAGMTFTFRLGEETGASAPALARAYAVAREVFAMRDFWDDVEALDNQIEAGTQLAVLIEGRRLVDRAARWLVRARGRSEIDVAATTARFASGARALAQSLPGVLQGNDRESFQDRLVELAAAGVPPALAQRTASMPALLSVFDIVEEAEITDVPSPVVTAVYFGIGSRLGLDWLRDRILELPRNDRWQALARSALRDDLYDMHRALVRDVLARGTSLGAPAAIDAWLAVNQAAVERSQSVVADVKAARTYDTMTLPVALRELKNLVSETG